MSELRLSLRQADGSPPHLLEELAQKIAEYLPWIVREVGNSEDAADQGQGAEPLPLPRQAIDHMQKTAEEQTPRLREEYAALSQAELARLREDKLQDVIQAATDLIQVLGLGQQDLFSLLRQVGVEVMG
jgi:hypothetical protein